MGVRRFFTSFASEAIFPNSVSLPVAKTAATPFPDSTVVPAKRTFFASRTVSLLSTPGNRLTGLDSPVSVAIHVQRVRLKDHGVRSDAVTFLDDQDIAGHQKAGIDLCDLSSPAHLHQRGDQFQEGVDRPVCFILLPERERGIDDDGTEDRISKNIVALSRGVKIR